MLGGLGSVLGRLLSENIMSYTDIDCPYCGHGQDVCHDDGQNYAEDETHEMECYECEKTFVFSTSISFCYDSSKADCLNGSDHKYEATHTYPKERTKMRCVDCDKTRPCTKEEMETALAR
jgi:DNA-directed RNA polymerase subunit RPC12/RpoP